MRWQTPARVAIAVFVLVFAGVVFVRLRRPPVPVVPSTTPRVDQKTVVEVGPLTYRRTTSDGKVAFEINAKSDFTYPDGRHLMKEAELTLPQADGGTAKIFGGEMELIIPANGGQPLQTATITKGAKLRTSDGLEMTSAQAIYDERTGIVNVPGDVRFTKGRMTGTGLGASYDRGRNVIWLLDRAHISVTPDEKGQGAVEATAKAAGLARNEHYLKLTGDAHVVGEGRTLDATELTVQMTPDDKLIQSMALRGNSRITGGAGASGAQGMSARDIDLTYAPDGRTIQQAHLVENAVVQMGGGAGERRVAAPVIDLTMSPDGSVVTSLNANGNVQLDLPAVADAPARRITSASLIAGGPNGLQTATFVGGVSYKELRPARRGGPAASERTARTQRLIVQTQPGLGSVEQADFHGSVHIVDGDTTVEGQRAVHRAAQDTFEITLSPGDPGPPPSVNDGRIMVNAKAITVGITSKQLKAETDVRSSVQPSRPQAAGKPVPPAPGRGTASPSSPQPGTASRPADSGKTPAIMKADQPVNVTAQQLNYDGAAGVATYTGTARLWQDQTRIQGDTIVVDDRTGNLTSRGHVITVMFFDDVDPKTKQKQPVQTRATADAMVYDDAKRIATYTSGATGKAHMVGTQGDLAAEQIQLFLKPGGGELDRAEADREVVVKENLRTVIGLHLLYTPADQTYVITGAPVEIEEKKTATECRVSYATKVTFQRDGEATTMENNNVAPVKLRQCVTLGRGAPTPPKS
jgi:lipopolysaccharide transport protein LptA